MKIVKFVVLLFVCALGAPTYAFTTDDERIDHYLEVLDTGHVEAKRQMLERLQWSGLADARLYDEVERRLLSQYNNGDFDRRDLEIMNYEVRALGYSGNAKYQVTLEELRSNRSAGKLRHHAKKALRNLDDFIVWNRLVAKNELVVEGKSAEIVTYMKMLDTNNVFVQRLAARAIFHERLRDKDLLALTANKLESSYMRENLSREQQDTAAWFCKAVGQSGLSQYLALLAKVAAETPHKKIKKYASQY